MSLLVPVDAKRADWPRLVANAINQIRRDLDLGNAISHAERVVQTTYGDTVSVNAKGKSLNKFGRNRAVGTSWETVAEFQGTTANETFVSTNLIDSIVSDAAGTQTITIEGHTIDGSGNLTFVVQNATLNGTTEVTLTTPLARATRAYVANSGTFDSPQTEPTGNVYIYDNTDGISSGVPVTPAATKLMILAGASGTDKCATAISSSDYWFIKTFTAGIGDAGASANLITVRLQLRDVANGGVWRAPARDITLIPGQIGKDRDYEPFIIVPKNHDVRVIAKCDSNTAEVYAALNGYLAAVQ